VGLAQLAQLILSLMFSRSYPPKKNVSLCFTDFFSLGLTDQFSWQKKSAKIIAVDVFAPTATPDFECFLFCIFIVLFIISLVPPTQDFLERKRTGKPEKLLFVSQIFCSFYLI